MYLVRIKCNNLCKSPNPVHSILQRLKSGYSNYYILPKSFIPAIRSRAKPLSLHLFDPQITDTTLYMCICPRQSKTYSRNRGKDLYFDEVPVIHNTESCTKYRRI